MADEENTPKEPDLDATDETLEPPTEETDPDHGDGDDTPQYTRRVMLSARNASVLGQMFVSYPSRDVVLVMDGDAALRLLRIFQNRSEGGLEDRLDAATSSAHDGWVVLDAIEQPMAMSWLPGLPGKRPRTAIDPVVTT
jgi:hypothetical protein